MDLADLRLDPGDALFLDLDGTLAELRDDPDAVRLDLPDPQVPATRRLAELTVRGRTTVLQGPERLGLIGANGNPP